MNNDDYLKRMKEYSDELCKDPVRLKVFLRRIMGRPHKTLEGDEKKHTMLLLNLTEPYKQTNNQQSWTDYYMIGETEYHVTYFPGSNDPIIDKMLPEDEE
jgi:hypothetical protein